MTNGKASACATRERTPELEDALAQLRSDRVSRRAAPRKSSRYIGACATSGIVAGIAFGAIAGLEGLAIGVGLGLVVGFGIGRILEWDERRRAEQTSDAMRVFERAEHRSATANAAPSTRDRADADDSPWHALLTPIPPAAEVRE